MLKILYKEFDEGYTLRLYDMGSYNADLYQINYSFKDGHDFMYLMRCSLESAKAQYEVCLRTQGLSYKKLLPWEAPLENKVNHIYYWGIANCMLDNERPSNLYEDEVIERRA